MSTPEVLVVDDDMSILKADRRLLHTEDAGVGAMARRRRRDGGISARFGCVSSKRSRPSRSATGPACSC